MSLDQPPAGTADAPPPIPAARRRSGALAVAGLRWLRRIVVAIVVLAAIAWIAVPIAVRHAAETQGSALLTRQLRIRAIHFNPLTLALRFDDVAIAGPRPGAPDALSFKHLEVVLKWSTVWKLAPVAKSTRLDSLVVRVARTGAGHFDFDDILEHMAQRRGERGRPLNFALYNIELVNGRIEFDDRPVQRRHLVEQISIGVPFVSTIPADAEVEVQPRLAFVLDGTRYDTFAQATPFHLDRTGTLELQTGEIALAPWLAYWPAALGWKPARGRVKAELTLAFSRPPTGPAHLTVGGDLHVDDFAVVAIDGAPLFGWRSLLVRLRELQPFQRKVAVQSVSLDGLDLALERDAGGALNLVRAMTPSAAQPAASSPSPSPADAAPWSASVDDIDVNGARIAWRDASVSPAAAYAFQDARLRVSDLRWPMPPGPAAAASAPVTAASPAAALPAPSAPAPAVSASSAASGPAISPMPVAARGGQVVRMQLTARVATSPAPGKTAATSPAASGASGSASASPGAGLVVEGRLGAQRSELDVRIDRLPIAALGPYLGRVWTPSTEGDLSTRLQARWDGPMGSVLPTLDVAQLGIDALRLREPGSERAGPAASWQRVQVDGLRVDLARQQVELDAFALTKPEFWLERDANGGLNVARWSAARTSGGAASAPLPQDTAVAASAASSAGSGWQARIGRVAVADGRVHWRDAPAAGPVAFDVDTLQLDAVDLGWPTAGRAPANVKLQARVSQGDRGAGAGAGRLDFDGRVGLAPLTWQGRVRAERLPLHAADAYLAASPLQLLHADVGWQGSVEGGIADNGLQLRVKGDALLTDVHARARTMADPANAEDLLSWQSLAVGGTDLAMTPGRSPTLAVGHVKLAGAYARLVVTEQGRFNLADLAPPATAASGPPSDGEAASAAAPAAPEAPTAASASGGGAPPDIRVGGIEWTDSRIEYTDRFIRPNYSADLSGLTGSLGAFSARTPGLAALELKGRVEGTGILDVKGMLNPLAKPLALDVSARATDIELAPLSPYAGKYAGYAIERGKLTMNVHYKVQPDGHLEASNQIVLNQLTFGEKVESPSATKLPVLFAVALLKDRNGVIDINLPVAGSINDPKFSVGGIIWKLILNLLAKAVTAPFALLAGGGGQDLSQVLFVSGTARLESGSDAALDKVAKALQDRPALHLTITGLADDDQEHADMQAANLDARLAGLRRTEMLQAGTAEVPDAPAMTPEDRTRLVKRLYADTRLPDKPRNMVGLAKDVPQPEMESRLKAGLPLPADAARQLAVQRALVVRDALTARGLPNERMFVASPKVHGAGSAEPEAWRPHVQLELSSR